MKKNVQNTKYTTYRKSDEESDCCLFVHFLFFVKRTFNVNIAILILFYSDIPESLILPLQQVADIPEYRFVR